MHVKQEHVDSLNYFNDTLFLTPVCWFCNQTIRFNYRSDAMLLTISTSYSQSNESNGLGSTWDIEERTIRVYEQYTRQDHPMENTETILQYYTPWCILYSSVWT